MVMLLFSCLSGSLLSVSSECKLFNRSSRSSYRSTTAIVLHLHHALWLHLRGMDGGRYLLFCCIDWSRLCLRSLPDILP